jgi:hypothetical protein
MSPSDTLVNLVSDPSTLVRIRADQRHRDFHAFELPVDPFFDCGVALALDCFKVSLIDASRLEGTRDSTAIAYIHGTLHIVILEPEENLARQCRPQMILLWCECESRSIILQR